MAKMTTDSPCCEGDDWLVVGCDDGSRESAASGPQSEANSTETRDKRGLEASQGENQILDSDQHSEDEKLKANVSEKEPHGEQESDTSQTTAKKQDRNIFQLLVWHNGLETPIKIVDETQKPLLVAADKCCSLKELQCMVQEMVIMQPQLRGVFPQVTREDIRDVIQVCERSHEKMKWEPLGRDAETEELRYAEKNGGVKDSSSAARLKLTSEINLSDEKQWSQLLVEGKFDIDLGGEIMDWRRGRFYSDVQENAWRFQLQIGQLVDAVDTDNRWYESRVVDMDAVYVKVHYRGWTSKWDEWLRRTSVRLAPLHTKVPNWRAFQVGDEILVGSEVPGKRYPEWRDARVTACDYENGSLQIEVDVDGKKKWLDAQDELLCAKGTHKAVNTGTKVDSVVFSVPPSLLLNYFDRPEELPPSPPRKNDAVNEVESVREATHAMHLADSDADGDEWCVVDDNDDRDDEGAEEIVTKESNNQTETCTTVVESEAADSGGSDTSGASAEPAFNALGIDEHSSQGIISPTIDQIFATTAEVLDGQMDATISEEDAWCYQLQIGQLIDARDTDNVWYESRVVALSSTLVKLHYRGWTSKWDEWIERTSTRIAPLHTKVRNWRNFKVGSAVMVGRNVDTKKYPEWRNAVITACKACEVDGRLRIEVDVDGRKQWMDAQDEMLCPPGTHKASNSSMLNHMVVLRTAFG